VFGAAIVGALVVAAHRRVRWHPAAIAAVLLMFAAALTVLPGLPSAAQVTPRYAEDRHWAASAALAAGMCALVAVWHGARAERALPGRRVARLPVDWARVRQLVVAATPAVVIAVVALAVRIALVPDALRPDFRELVENLRLGNGYARGSGASLEATGLHPPLAPLLAAVLPGLERAALVAVSMATVVTTAALGWRLGGRRGAIAAGASAALLPSLWGLQLPEALAALAVSTAVVLAWPGRPSGVSAALAGLCLGAGALARPEVVLVVPVLVAWLGLASRGGGRWGVAPLAALAATAALVLTPWTIWMHEQFGTWLPSTSLGATLLGSNAEPVTSGTRLGELDPLPAPPTGAREGQLDEARRRQGWERLRDQAGPALAAARAGRAWDMWSPEAVVEARDARGLDTPGGSLGVVLEGAASATAFGWLIASRRSWRARLPFYALPIAFTLLSVLTFGSRDLRGWVAPFVATAVGLVLARVVPKRPSRARARARV
jgi:hypothetical protein